MAAEHKNSPFSLKKQTDLQDLIRRFGRVIVLPSATHKDT